VAQSDPKGTPDETKPVSLMLTSRRTRRAVAFLCLATLALAVFLPGMTAADYAVVPAGE
jgi:hypothetical protein